MMPFDPAKPANSWAEIRAQLTGLKAVLIDADLNNAIVGALNGTSNNTNGVTTLGLSADADYSQSQMQDVLNKLDELINAARR